MSDTFGSDFISIVDEDGVEYELEVLHTLEYNGQTYLAVAPGAIEDGSQYEISILRSEEEDGDSILCVIDDEQELEAVYSLIMEQIYEDEDSE